MKFLSTYHPLEILRKAICAYRDSASDFSLRYPETRRRYALEIRLRVPKDDLSSVENFIHRLEKSKAVISIFDWPLLLEYNERRLLALYLAEMNLRCKEASTMPLSPLSLRIEEYFLLWSDEIRQDLQRDPWGFWRSVWLRWRYAGLRDEINYYLTRWDEAKKMLKSAVS